jgi:hypothetical protein
MRSDRRRKALGRNDRAGIEAKRHRCTAELLNEQNHFVKKYMQIVTQLQPATQATSQPKRYVASDTGSEREYRLLSLTLSI